MAFMALFSRRLEIKLGDALLRFPRNTESTYDW